MQQMQIVGESDAAEIAVPGAVDFIRRPEVEVDLINIVDQLHHVLVRQVVVQPAPELGGQIIFSIGKRPGPAKTRA
jgi:hypothetical protein